MSREEIDKVLRHYLESTCSAVIGICTIKKVCEEGEICPIINKLLPDFKKDLHSKGVVRKVDNKTIKGRIGYIPAGYVAVAPLMEE